jgi:hypothetical protein
MVTKLENQLKQERVVNKERLVNIHDLEQIIISLGEDPNDKNGVKSLVKEKDKEIQVLKSKLKILASKHVQTKELVEA